MTVALQGSPQLVTRNAVPINLEGPILMQGRLKKKEGMMKVKWVDVFVEVREVCVATFSAGSNPRGSSCPELLEARTWSNCFAQSGQNML
jgi:hypothetical protein